MLDPAPFSCESSRIWQRAPEAARASLLLLTILLLTGVCTLLACRECAPHSNRADFDLLADTSSPNLNLTSAEPCVALAAATVPRDSLYPTVAPSSCESGSAAAPPESPQRLVLDNFELAPPAETWESLAIPIRHHGDSPMMRNWKLLGLDMMLLGALAAQVAAGQIDGPPAEANKEDIVIKEVRELKAAINDLAKAIKSLQESTVTTGVQLQKTVTEVDTLKRQISHLQQEEMDGLRRQIAQLQKDVDDLKARAARVSAYQPQAPTAPATGRIRIVNAYTVPETIILNSRAYSVNPGAVLNVESVPAGSFTYEVLGVQAPVNRTLANNETFTITIHP